jgi:DNA-binding transcriptional ArsR family regulator
LSESPLNNDMMGQYFNSAQLAKSLADENRLRILRCLGEGKQSVSALVEKLGLSQPLVSHHLRELKRTCLVRVERKGPFIYYQLADNKVLDLLQSLNKLADLLIKSRTSF